MLAIQAPEKPISVKELAIFEYIKSFIEANQLPPSHREIMAGCGLSSTSVVKYQLEKLRKRGLIRIIENRARGIQIVNPE